MIDLSKIIYKRVKSKEKKRKEEIINEIRYFRIDKKIEREIMKELRKKFKWKIIFLTFLLFISILQAVDWSNTKKIDTAKFTIESPQEVLCEIYPDHARQDDYCTAYFIVKNKWKTISLEKALMAFEFLNGAKDWDWQFYGKTEYNEYDTTDGVRKKEMQFKNPIEKPITSSVGQTLNFSISFRKPRWTTDQFNLTISDTKLDPDVSACGTLSSSGTYTLTNSVHATGTCFTVQANHVVIDCQGNTINYSRTTAGYGVYITASYQNLTIRNCNINMTNNTGGVASAYGVYSLAPTYLTIQSTNFTQRNTTAYAIRTATNYSVVEGCYFWCDAFGAKCTDYQIYFAGANNSVARNNYFDVRGAQYGVYAVNGFNNTVVNNSFQAPVSLLSTGAINFQSSTWNVSILDNNASGISGTCIFIAANASIVYENNCTGSGTGINIGGPSTGIQVLDNWVYGTSSGSGIQVSSNAFNHFIARNFVNMTSTGAGVYHAATPWESIQNIMYFNNTIYSNLRPFRFGSSATIFGGKNITITGGFVGQTGTGTWYPAQIDNRTEANFTNVTGFNISKISWGAGASSNVSVKWFVLVNVTDSAGNPLDATINITDNFSNLISYEDSGIDGLSEWRLFTQFIGNNSVNTSFVPLRVKVNKTGYFDNVTYTDLSNSTAVYRIILTKAPEATKTKLLLENYDADISVTYPTQPTATAYLTTGTGTINLYINGTLYTSGTSPLSTKLTLAAGYYYIYANFSGTSEYISSENATHYLLIEKGTPIIRIRANTSNYVTGDWIIEENTTIRVWCDNAPETTSDFYLDGTVIPNPYSTKYLTGKYQFTCNANETQNYSSQFTSRTLEVRPLIGIPWIFVAIATAFTLALYFFRHENEIAYTLMTISFIAMGVLLAGGTKILIESGKTITSSQENVSGIITTTTTEKITYTYFDYLYPGIQVYIGLAFCIFGIYFTFRLLEKKFKI